MTLRISYRIDADAVAFYAENGMDETEAVDLAYRTIKDAYPSALVDVDTTTGLGCCWSERTDANGEADWQRGDDDITEAITDAINAATEKKFDAIVLAAAVAAAVLADAEGAGFDELEAAGAVWDAMPPPA